VERRTGKDKKENRVGKGQNGERKRIIRRTKTRKDKTVEVDGMGRTWEVPVLGWFTPH
jgi:hypothetical protein